MATPYEIAGRAEKVLDLVQALEQIAAEQKFTAGPVALSVAIENPAFDWQSVADRVTKLRREKGDARTCGLPSAETRAKVVAHFRGRVTLPERAVLKLAGSVA